MRTTSAKAPRHYEQDSPLRKVIVDVGAAATRRHPIPAWFSADLTDVIPRLQSPQGTTVSVYVIATLARTVAHHPRMHATRDLRGRVVVFDDVDVNVSVEVDAGGQPFPMNHVLRSADQRSTQDLHRELHAVKRDPRSSTTMRLGTPVRAYLALPAPARSRLLGAIRRWPDRQKALIGTVGLSSVGTAGRGSGLGLPFLVHTLDLLVGGMETRPGFGPNGILTPRQHLWVSLVADHDLVDGAAVARFVAELRDALEAGTVLDSSAPAGSP